MRILLDLDGVITDLVQHMQDYFDIHINPWPANNYNIASVLGLESDQMWNNLPASFWSTMPFTVSAHYVLELLDGHDVYLCTAPTNADCIHGKMQWLHRHMPTFMQRKKYVVTWHKHLLATPGTLLIDDSNANIDAFTLAGGEAILFPADWNRNRHIKDPVAYLERELLCLMKTESRL